MSEMLFVNVLDLNFVENVVTKEKQWPMCVHGQSLMDLVKPLNNNSPIFVLIVEDRRKW